MDKKTNKSSNFNGFIEGKGFYITLTLCLCIIGASGYVLFLAPTAQPTFEVEMPTTKATENAKAGANIPNITVEIETQAPTQATTQEPTEQTTQVENKAVVNPDPIAVIEKIYLPPIIGEITKSFSNGDLVYDQTMGDYRTHNGTDIACEIGETISCFGDGIVEKVHTDELYGTCVTIDHGDNLKSIYKGLDKTLTLKEGSKISVGDEIGKLSDGNISEASQESHLHFEVLKDGKYVDPFEYIE